MEQVEVLRTFREADALLDGHFELRSGLHSDRYFQCAQALRDPAVAERLCAALTDRLRAGLGDALPVDGVVAPALGGLIVGYEVARALKTPFIFVEKNKDQALELRRFSIEKGTRLIIAEDVVTRGGRVGETVRIVEQNGGEVVGIAMLVDRSAGQATFDYPVFSLLQMAPEAYEPKACPLCAKGMPLTHPGS